MANEMHKPVLEGKGATDYERYLRTDDLLSLQTVTEHLSHPDELTFQVVHQSSELLMKGASWELERARVALTEGNYPNSARLMRRADAMLEHPISLLRILETSRPTTITSFGLAWDTAAGWIRQDFFRCCTSRPG